MYRLKKVNCVQLQNLFYPSNVAPLKQVDKIKNLVFIFVSSPNDHFREETVDNSELQTYIKQIIY